MSHTLHMVALPHTELTNRDLSCAYSQKVRRACGMFRAEGHTVILYGPDRADVDVDEHVVIHTRKDRKRWGFKDFNTVTSPLLWEDHQPYFAETNMRAAAEVAKRASDRDLLLLTTSTQRAVADLNPHLTVAEWTVGYEGIVQRGSWFAAFESYAWMHHVYGKRGIENGRAFDTVIPNFFDPSHFHMAKSRDGYLLFVGRVLMRKGPHIAAEIAERVGMPLVVAGPGGRVHNGILITEEGVPVEGDVEYVGEVGFKDRADLMARAECLIAPTLYIEPFGGVAVEAMLSNTPVLASDWGAFTETVTDDVGARFRTLTDAPAALEQALRRRDGDYIRRTAISRYGMDTIGPRYTAWFDALDTLWDEGWYQETAASDRTLTMPSYHLAGR
jgi:glycosyltransferase involved in cell wall biosynthesis